jgi:hypothetical protein
MSGGRGGQLDERIVAQRCDGFQGHVAGALDGPLVVLFEEDGTDEANDGLVVGEDADDLGAALDLTVDALDRAPTTSVRRLISPLTRSIGLVECNFGRCAGGKLI